MVSQLFDEVREFQKDIPIIQALASPAMRHHHWEDLAKKLGRDDIVPVENETTLDHYFKIGIRNHVDDVLAISTVAEKQFGLEKALAAMKAEWYEVYFECVRYELAGHASETRLSEGADRPTFSFIVHSVDDICGSSRRPFG